jgi:hypothetical protein
VGTVVPSALHPALVMTSVPGVIVGSLAGLYVAFAPSRWKRNGLGSEMGRSTKTINFITKNHTKPMLNDILYLQNFIHYSSKSSESSELECPPVIPSEESLSSNRIKDSPVLNGLVSSWLSNISTSSSSSSSCCS